MSWQAATFALLAVVLIAGFAWYERSRPDARMIALVAALAALAVAGRLALTPFPNVVATTDVALITGYALGAAPGFAVGALAAPITNMWLGQGPWTVWQMAGWGLAGLLGAALARAANRRLGRLSLAIACAAMGLIYGALLDLSTMVSYGGEQSLDRYLALSVRGIPFNVAHALGNFAIAMAAGPALVRMISRYRERINFRWHAAGALPLIGVMLALAVLPGFLRGEDAKAAAGAPKALRWLASQQGKDGGFAQTPGYSSNAPMTGWVMLGLEAAHRNPLDVKRSGNSPVDFLRRSSSRIRSIGDLERTVLALEGAGVDSRSFAGRNLVHELVHQRSHNGSYLGQVNLTAFGILATRAAGAGGLSKSAGWLRATQNSDGGWGFRPGAPSDADSTGAAAQGLAAAGSHGATLGKAVRYLRRSQVGDGGWTLASGASNSQSTAWAIQGLLAGGASPGAVKSSGRSGLDYLSSRQRADGHYTYSHGSDQTPIWVTAQALVASRRKVFPIAAVPPSQSGSPTGSRSSSNGAANSSPDAANGAATSGGSNSGGESGAQGTSRSPGAGGGSGRNGHSGQNAVDHPPSGAPAHPGGGGDGSSGAGDASTDPRLAGNSSETLPGEPGAAAARGTDEHDDGSDTALVLGIGALAIALGAGISWYRRRI